MSIESNKIIDQSRIQLKEMTTNCPEHVSLITQNGHFGYRVTDDGEVYDVMRCDGVFNQNNPTLAQRIAGRRAYAVMDPKIGELYGKKIRTYFEYHKITNFRFNLPFQPVNEYNKDLWIAAQLTKEFKTLDLQKSDVIILVGGGVVKDLGGWVAKSYRRGVPFIAIPTTLLAIVDAAPSPKCAVTVLGEKNAWSDKHYPEVVFYDHSFLETLSDDAVREGLAEVVKVATIGSPDLFHRLENESFISLRKELCSGSAGSIVADAIKLFLELKWTGPYYGNDPASIRDFAHGFSRELESISNFSLTHGQAVSLEMHVATRLARNLGKLDKCASDRILGLLSHLNLCSASVFCDAEIIWETVFRRSFEKGSNFYYPVPFGVGRGGFLSTFSFDDLYYAIHDGFYKGEIISVTE